MQDRARGRGGRQHDQRDDRAPVTFLVDDAFGGGGVGRTVSNVANQLVHRRPVSIISMHRKRDEPRYPLDPRIAVTVLRDRRRPDSRVASVLDRYPSRLRPAPSAENTSLWTDLLLRRALASVRSGFVVSTRPSLHLAAVSFAPRRVATVAWDHLNYPARAADPQQLAVLTAALERLDAFVVLTEADAADYRLHVPRLPPELAVIRNSVTWPVESEPPPLTNPVVVSAGRISRRKGTHRLVRAFALVAPRHPGWELHLYGDGELKGSVRALVRELGLQDRVRLQGYTHELPSVMSQASVFAMASRAEGFPMVLVEALSRGLPLVAFDCPRGPAEIIDTGGNGLLVPDGDLPGYAAALSTLIDDAELRRRLGRQALADAGQYAIDRIGADWEAMLDRVAAHRTRAADRTAGPRRRLQVDRPLPGRGPVFTPRP
jgi:glycosyltransferase involved in cell wall biosynthesis